MEHEAMKEAETTDATPVALKQQALERWENEGGPAYLPSCFRMQRNAQTVTALPTSSDIQSAGGVRMKSIESSSI